MARTLGYHYVKSGYGLWLPGDDRGSWSESWDEQIGFAEPHTLNEGDPIRERMAKERMKHEPVRLDTMMIDAVVGAIHRCASSSPGRSQLQASSQRTCTYSLPIAVLISNARSNGSHNRQPKPCIIRPITLVRFGARDIGAVTFLIPPIGRTWFNTSKSTICVATKPRNRIHSSNCDARNIPTL